ncbi:MAG: hypothetical protein ABL898_09455 [Hyphomicrobiaceae bacterium]
MWYAPTRQAWALAIALVTTTVSAAQKPTVPPGKDPGGTAIAVITTGIDYTDPIIAACLARDGEGELIAWDIIDNDRKPWRDPTLKPTPSWGTSSNQVLKSVPCQAGIRIIAVRVDPSQPITLGKALAFIAQTPARIAVLPMWSETIEDWLAFGSAADSFKDVLIITAAGDEQRNIDLAPVYPAAFALPGANWPALNNLVVVGSAHGDTRTQTNTSNFGSRTVALTVMERASDQPTSSFPNASPSGRAAIDVAWSLACSITNDTKPVTTAKLKARLLELRRVEPTSDGRMLFDPGCRNQQPAR